jgi:hypothetical protein
MLNDQLIRVLQIVNQRSEDYERRMQSSRVKRAMARMAITCVSREEMLRISVMGIVADAIEDEDTRQTVGNRCDELLRGFWADVTAQERVRGVMDTKTMLGFQREWVNRLIRDIEDKEDGLVFAMDDVSAGEAKRVPA